MGQEEGHPLTHRRRQQNHPDRTAQRFKPAALVRPANRYQHPRGNQYPPGLRQGPVSGYVHQQVVPPPCPGEILLGVVDDLVGPDRGDDLHVLRAAYARYLGAERLGELHRERPDPSGRAVDQDLLPRPDPALVAKRLHGRAPGDRHRRRLLERYIGRLFQQHRVLTDADVLGECSPVFEAAEHLVAGPELGHVLAHRLDRPCHVST